MSTDYQQARVALGVRLRELRIARPGGRLTGTQLAQRLGWTHSKIYKLENGKQTATPEDLRAWVDATEQPEAFDELYARLKGFESQIRSWRRQLASGHRPVQENWNSEIVRTRVIHTWQQSIIEGMLQTADYARHIFTRYAELRKSPRDADEAVRARLRRQELLYQPGRKFRIIMWEAALHALVCPPSVLAAQLDRLIGVNGLDTVELGIVPLNASLKIPAANAFYVLDDRVAVTEDWHAELWLEDEESITLYLSVWNMLRQSAVYGTEAQNVINRARRSLCLP
ncbi:XRE family transcriptional regulator [Streptomyces inhibens]|uniref:XRE family transcriptional regulator n=1 Tax=Streptomyces inhibens TaxID=2293571 RepID=A0A371Q1Y7_STRIH|nr:helix-turn-helix transcriptional regulator [Streptomyces inhibens]REK88722.1 XRE family transcriptional regulator [Streptomyces inhibens]